MALCLAGPTSPQEALRALSSGLIALRAGLEEGIARGANVSTCLIYQFDACRKMLV